MFGYSELSTNNDSDDNYWWHVSKCLFMCFHFKIQRKIDWKDLVASSVVIFSLSAMYYLTEFKYEDLCFSKGG